MKAKILCICVALIGCWAPVSARLNPRRKQLHQSAKKLYVAPVISASDYTSGVGQSSTALPTAKAQEVLGGEKKAFHKLSLRFHPDQKQAQPSEVVQWLFKLDLPIKVKVGTDDEFRLLHELSDDQIKKVTADNLMAANNKEHDRIFKMLTAANEAITQGVDPTKIYQQSTVVDAQPAKRQVTQGDSVENSAEHNQAWRTAGYWKRLQSHLHNRTLQDQNDEMARRQEWHEKTKEAVQRIRARNTETHDAKDAEKLNEKIKDPDEVNPKDVQTHNSFAPQRWWQAASAVGVNPSLLTDAVDLATFTSAKKRNVIAGAALAGVGRALDTGLNRPFAHTTLTAHEAKTYIPANQREVFGTGTGDLARFKHKKPKANSEEDQLDDPNTYVDLATRTSAAAKQASMFPAQGLNIANQYIAQPLSLLTDTGYTVLNQDELALYNAYLQKNKHKQQVKRYLDALRKKRLTMGGIMALESMLNAAKYAVYLKQERDPSAFYANSDDATLVEWSNRLSALSAALSLLRRGWWNWTKAQHIDRAQQHTELEQYRNRMTIGQRPVQP